MDFSKAATPVAFLYVTDRDRALAFYRDHFGVEVESSDAFGDFLRVGGTLVRLTTTPDHQASPNPVLGWNVPDIRAARRWLQARGIELTRIDGSGQDELGIWAAPDGAVKVGYLTDPDGNVLTLSETK